MSTPDDKERRPTEDLLPLVYDELREVARAYLRKQPASFTLRPTDLVDEAYLHIARFGEGEWNSPEHFRAIATKKIWQVIVDHLRTRRAQKRGGAPQTKAPPPDRDPAAAPLKAPGGRKRVPLEAVTVEWRDQSVDILDLAEALEGLAVESRRLWDIVMLHWFGGIKYADVGRLMDLSESTIEKDFRYALAWLNRRLAPGAADAH